MVKYAEVECVVISDSNSGTYIGIISAALIIVYLFNQGSATDITKIGQDTILPSSGYCVEFKGNISYEDINNNGTMTKIEYCKLDSFCEKYEVSSVYSSSSFEQEKLDTFIGNNSNLLCFQDVATNSQKGLPNAATEYIKSKFACCRTTGLNVTQNNCRQNTCNGIYYGTKTSYGCRIFENIASNVTCGGII